MMSTTHLARPAPSPAANFSPPIFKEMMRKQQDDGAAVVYTVSLAQLLERTVDVVMEVFSDLRDVETPGDVVDVVFREDRRTYVGVALLVLALLLALLFS